MKHIATIRQYSDDQLKARLRDIGNSLIRANGRNAAGKPEEDTMFIGKLKTEKARILTILREREINREKQKA